MSKLSRKREKQKAITMQAVSKMIREATLYSFSEQNAFVDRLSKQLEEMPDNADKVEAYCIFLGFLDELKKLREGDEKLVHKSEIVPHLEHMRAEIRDVLLKTPEFVAEYIKVDRMLSDAVVSLSSKERPVPVEKPITWLDIARMVSSGVEKEVSLANMREKADRVRAESATERESRNAEIQQFVAKSCAANPYNSKVAIYDAAAKHFGVSRSTVQRAIRHEQ